MAGLCILSGVLQPSFTLLPAGPGSIGPSAGAGGSRKWVGGSSVGAAVTFRMAGGSGWLAVARWLAGWLGIPARLGIGFSGVTSCLTKYMDGWMDR